MVVGPRKRLLMSERQQRVIQLFHQGKTTREISEQLRQEAGDRKGWGISHTQVRRDIAHVEAYYQQQAVDHYANWLARELSLADHGLRMAAKAFEESKLIRKEKTSTLGQGSITEEKITTPGDADFSREMREWSAWRIKLLGYCRENHKTPQAGEGPQDEPAVNLAPYAQALGIFAASVAAQQHGNIRPDHPPQQVPTPQADQPPGPLPAPQ